MLLTLSDKNQIVSFYLNNVYSTSDFIKFLWNSAKKTPVLTGNFFILLPVLVLLLPLRCTNYCWERCWEHFVFSIFASFHMWVINSRYLVLFSQHTGSQLTNREGSWKSSLLASHLFKSTSKLQILLQGNKSQIFEVIDSTFYIPTTTY